MSRTRTHDHPSNGKRSEARNTTSRALGQSGDEGNVASLCLLPGYLSALHMKLNAAKLRKEKTLLRKCAPKLGERRPEPNYLGTSHASLTLASYLMSAQKKLRRCETWRMSGRDGQNEGVIEDEENRKRKGRRVIRMIMNRG